MNRRVFFGAILAAAATPLVTGATRPTQIPAEVVAAPPGGVLIWSDTTTTLDQSGHHYRVVKTAEWFYRQSLNRRGSR